MTREELASNFESSDARSYILELATGYGKSKLALEKTEQWYTPDATILIVIPKLILIDGWKKEIRKWKKEYLLPNITFVTYVSFPKIARKSWTVIIFDEAHHLSERCREFLDVIDVQYTLFLSATLKKEHKFYINAKFKSEPIKVNNRDAIKDGVLPDPKVILLKLKLDNRIVNRVIEKNINKNNSRIPVRTIGHIETRKYRSYKGPSRILCTQQQYYDDASSLIEWYKQKGMHSAVMKNVWLHKSGERLKWLAAQKEEIVKGFLKNLSNYRTLVFCPTIEDSMKLGSPCINSKVGTASLDAFNNKKIKHIVAVGMLDEGANITDCKIGIFQMINSSDRLNIQRVGRILRHKKPVLIFPYFINTREDDIVKDVTSGYNPDLIKVLDCTTITNLAVTMGELKKYID